MKKPQRLKLNFNIDSWRHPMTGGVTGGLLLLTCLAALFFFTTKNSFNSHYQETNLAREKLTSLQDNQEIIQVYEKALHQTPQQFTEFKRKRFDESATINDIRSRLQKWQKTYKIQSLTTQFGTDQIESRELNLWKMPISIEIKVLQDKQFHQFLEKIQQELPGMTTIRSFNLKRVSALTAEVLDNVAAGKTASMFDGKIELDWTHLGTVSAGTP
jgi:hypothetical protein